MIKRTLLFVITVTLFIAWGCGSARQTGKVAGGVSLPPGLKIKVADVSNDTGKVFDVDLIGLFWDGLNDELRKQSLLWTKDTPGTPLLLEAHIIKYQKGDDIQRLLVPGLGSTVLTVKCNLKEGDQVVGTVEAQRKIAYGDALTIRVWKKIFTSVAEDTVKELRIKLHAGV
jgi:hypothetical protein